MRVKWVNLLRDPSTPASADNRLTGRYAFWMDDESSRINYNLALGKPVRTSGQNFGDHYKAGFVTPLFTKGDANTNSSNTGTRNYALGRPQSVNLDILFDTPAQLLHEKLLSHTFLHGFSRYPEAIMDFINVPSPREWYDKEKFNLTFYSRSPEFNAFGRSRFFTTYIPLSLEAGPSYQHPFVHDPANAYGGGSSQILNLNSLLGFFGFTAATTDEDGEQVSGGNVVNEAQMKMLMEYFARKWPGYQHSFLEKYGWKECTQLALNILLYARMATSEVATADLTEFSKQWGTRTTSVSYSPPTGELAGEVPERLYWRIKNPNTGATKLFLPQTPGPHLTEVRLFVRSVPADPAPQLDAAQLAVYTDPRYIEYYYEVEYYMHGMGPIVDLTMFPTKVDYFKIDASQALNSGSTRTKVQTFAHKNWNNPATLGDLQIVAADPEHVLGPANGKLNNSPLPVLNRRVVRSKVHTLGSRAGQFPKEDQASTWDPFVFDSKKGKTVTTKINLRLGLGGNAGPRTRQMIPLGLAPEDTLSATFAVNLKSDDEQVVSWQINDPRLSHDLANWENPTSKTGPGKPDEIGTPGEQNVNEPAEDSSELSKYRYVQRSHDAARIVVDGTKYPVNRADEYNPAGRTASPGYWSLLHTGMQSRAPWRTVNLGPASAQNDPPDWLLLDLFGATYPMAHDQWKIDATLPDEFSTPSFMNSTAGQVNLNSRIYPRTAYFNPPERRKPLEAVFKNLVSDSNLTQIVDGLGAYQTDDEVFDYVGEAANAAGFTQTGSTQWLKETLVRNMAGVLTTRSNTFGIWGVAQSVQKLPRNSGHDQFELGDQVRAEKRFYALVERYIWPGKDGVPGNAHANNLGRWDRLAKQSGSIDATEGMTDTLFQLPGSPPLTRPAATQQRLDLDTTGTYPKYDGPEAVGGDAATTAALGKIDYESSSLEDAYNPPQPVIKYRVVYFKYLDQ